MSALRRDPVKRLLGLPVEQEEERRPGPRGKPSEYARSGGRKTIAQLRREGWRSWLGVAGPGVITGASDDDPCGIGTFTQAGAQFGYGFLWVAIFILPLMYVVQEACQRIALQTGHGLAVLLKRRFPPAVIVPMMAAVALANIISLGADLGAVAAAVNMLSGVPAIWLLAPIAVAVLLVQVFGSYRLLERAFKVLTLALFAYIVAGFLSHPAWGQVLLGTIRPSITWSAASITTLTALLGASISPYLFIWQASSEVDAMRAAGAVTVKQRRGISKAGLAAARLDVALGMFFSQLVMYFAILTSGATLHAHGHDQVVSAAQAAQALGPFGGTVARWLFSLGIIGTGLLAMPVLSGSTAYALKAVVPGLGGSLEERWRIHPTFYGIVVVATLIGVGINYLHVNVIQALVVGSAINGAVAGPLLFMILAVGLDKKVMSGRRLGRVGGTVLALTAVLMTAAGITWLAVTV